MTAEHKIQKFGITSFVLHVLAMALMLCDHLWGTFLGKYEWLGYLGRIAFPLFGCITGSRVRTTKQ